MREIKFRALKADEVECRVGTCAKTYVTLLLYKDARCDMVLLDEVCTPMGWKREHSRDNANCTVSIWDDEHKQWVSKEDTGTASNTEAEKGLASDSFKRACVNWGIGRELYTAPFIKIQNYLCDIYDTGRKNKYGEPVYGCRTRFKVSKMECEEGCITALEIINADTGNPLFSWEKGKQKKIAKKESSKQAPSPTPEPAQDDMHEAAMQEFEVALDGYCKRTAKDALRMRKTYEQREKKPAQEWRTETLLEYAAKFDAAGR